MFFYVEFSVFCYFLPCVQLQPLALLEEDIREVLKEETGSDIFTQEQNQLQYRTYEVPATFKTATLCPAFV